MAQGMNGAWLALGVAGAVAAAGVALGRGGSRGYGVSTQQKLEMARNPLTDSFALVALAEDEDREVRFAANENLAMRSRERLRKRSGGGLYGDTWGD